MKRNVCIIVYALLVCLNVFSQATSLTVDCQNPGWLSSMINYGDQLTLENIKVSGYLNGTDFKFIRELNLNRNLNGCIDLEYANIVAGGESYGGSDNYIYVSTTTQDSILPQYIFAYLNPLRKVILPHSLVGFENNNGYSFQFLKTRVDTLVINGSMKDLVIGSGHDNIHWRTNCIYFPDSLETINFVYINNGELFFPSTIKKITGKKRFQNVTIHCKSTDPESITVYDYTNNNYEFFGSGIIYVPEGTTEKYQNSIFKELTIIEDIPVSEIKIRPLSHNIYSGDKYTFTAEVLPENAVNKGLTWNSSNDDIASINEDGLLLAKQAGSIYIKAVSLYYEIEDSLLVDIYNHTSGITISDNLLNMKIGSSYSLHASTLPLETSDGQIEWKTSNDKVATVDENGKVKAIDRGACTITATTVDGSFTADCEVKVIQPVENIYLDKHIITLKTGEAERLNPQITPATADNKTIDWSSSDEQTVKVDALGNVTALKAGEVWIKAVSNDNAEAKDSCRVTVIQPVTGITISQESCQMYNIGESVQLEATVLPEDATNKEINWKSSNEAICMVSQGKVIATGFGTAVAIASTVDGGFMASCLVTVEDTSAIHELTTSNSQDDSPIYNIMGCKVKNVIKGGLYIRNGQKIIAK